MKNLPYYPEIKIESINNHSAVLYGTILRIKRDGIWYDFKAVKEYVATTPADTLQHFFKEVYKIQMLAVVDTKAMYESGTPLMVRSKDQGSEELRLIAELHITKRSNC